MKNIILFAAPILGILTLIASIDIRNANAVEKIESPIVLELFTSQSCSSCPPADKLLGQLAEENKNIIALSCNVTYWNHLQWQDTLSKEFCTNRQRQYVQTLQSRGPYTPQIVINGRETMVGSHVGKIQHALSNQPVLKPIRLDLNENTLQIALPETPSEDSYALHLIVYKSTHQQQIPSGENKGRRVNYTNPVDDIISLGSWDGTGKQLNYDVSAITGHKGFVVLAQKNGLTGEIKAAGKIYR